MRPVVYFQTLYPKHINHRRSLDNTIDLIKGWMDKGIVDLKGRIGSAHEYGMIKADEKIQELFPGIDFTFKFIPFKKNKQMLERRGHEISFCKQTLMKQASKYPSNACLLFIDSDIYISFRDILKYREKMLRHKKAFIQFPYVMRDTMTTPPNQLGAFMIPVSCITRDHIKCLYAIKKDTFGNIYRKGAPDCRLIKQFKQDGLKKITANDITSYHYCREHVSIYNKGKKTREKR